MIVRDDAAGGLILAVKGLFEDVEEFFFVEDVCLEVGIVFEVTFVVLDDGADVNVVELEGFGE